MTLDFRYDIIVNVERGVRCVYEKIKEILSCYTNEEDVIVGSIIEEVREIRKNIEDFYICIGVDFSKKKTYLSVTLCCLDLNFFWKPKFVSRVDEDGSKYFKFKWLNIWYVIKYNIPLIEKR